MSYVNCLRLARQSTRSLLPTTVGNPRLIQPCRPFFGGLARGSTVAPSRFASGGSESGRLSRFAGLAESEEQSPFKRHRLAEFAKDEESEDPLFTELYPRIQSSSSRMSVAEFLDTFHEKLKDEDVPPVILNGRVRRVHVVGNNLMFVDVVNEFRKVQVMLSRKKCIPEQTFGQQKFAMFRNMLQVGDHISVKGRRTLTNTGSRTLEAIELPELLSPTMEQIPETLTDPKRRMQERHVDMLVNQEAVDILRLRSEIMRHMRDYFHSKKFLEFQTPILAENAGGAVARPFVTKATEFREKDMALRVAPELWLKRLVVGGIDKVFEIGPAFRNEGIDATHNPEFTTCEFYSAYSNLSDLMRETEELLCSLARHSQELISKDFTSLPPIDMSRFVRPFKKVEFVPALEAAMGIRLPKLSAEDALPELLAILKLSKIHIPGEAPDSLPKLLDRLAAMYIEPMSMDEPIFLINQPACMSPLAKSFLCPTTYQLVSARAELFIGGRELANMYEEENNPLEQRRKLESHRALVNMSNGEVGIRVPEGSGDSASMDSSDGDASPLDQSFIKALEYGLPPTGGWGCGVERLVMLFSGANRISDCLSFGTLRHVVSVSAVEDSKDHESS
ncbi:Lysine--tRNA ligase [Paramyrothecium foliicola]|nr:Lysine--tRNA ligase [Paramyrothecium foliicola]